ncbi:MAG: lmo0937 family membrane protein [Candidatus Obscuribacterales bacterium]|nr:lmo0937 family membrane protein [Candidatus Obscuribacterales bacterium]
MLYTLISLLVLFWLVGMVAHVGGGFIHGLLVLALIVFVFDLITGRRPVV